ncbi:MAG: polymerase, sigma-24 subunit, subfamily [Myxococcaceae bacterium]|nr:polymerase, sigma-24 subunit, subfamily [Myxococcaceae bacterium]
MSAYQQGDVSAFAELMTRHERPLWGFLRRLVRDAQAAEDLLQETFIRVVKGASSWQPQAKFSTWLYTIARNLCVDHARKQQHRRALSLDGQASAGEDDPSTPRLLDKLTGTDVGAEKNALNRELGSRLDRAIAALPELQREVFVMRELLDLSFAEIAAAVQAPEPTVKTRMRYALERLRAELSEERARAEVTP